MSKGKKRVNIFVETDGGAVEAVPTSITHDGEFQMEATPVESVVNRVQLKPGYIMIKHKSGKGGEVTVPEIHYGKVYPESEWDIIDVKKN